MTDEKTNLADLANQMGQMQDRLVELALSNTDGNMGISFFMIGLTVFILACFVGYYVIWNVTPALHSPLMSVTNAISGVVIVGALIAAGVEDGGMSKWFGFIAVVLASINIFGGFAVTDRMLSLFKKK